ncbi:von Willebrand factor type A [Catenulispora acidiphila DSM 44928]|uniref:von Willebrand factor type A n=1 Tax=Catenulispora acidiphila (strain DSM 44928 / JCM 14897 / NBRC 102108 / NRRL B-24433 / ID139908) TaxID=479433 RepID=C7Q840_CATAD|nr:substrate-binding and VWA domain-containing protein [Catenulispora acidiphila]ACU74207.1 von Willebrand factor type A [Catenulispora acidiphila DSM 44928]
MAHGHLHRSSPPRNARLSLPITLVVVLVLGASGGGAAWYAAGHRHAGVGSAAAAAPVSCPAGPTTVTAAVAPELASVLTPVLAAQPVPCVRVVMTAADSADTARFLAGSGAAPAGVRGRPDVWIPETSLWLELARATGAGQALLPQNGNSVADSPTVVAAPKAVAGLLGGQGAFSWEELVMMALARSQGAASGSSGSSGPSGPVVAIADPTHDGAGLSALIVLNAMLAQAVNDPQVKVGITGFVKGMADNVAPSPVQLAGKVFPASEQQIFTYNHGKPGAPLAALYPSDGSASLDYPMVVLNGADNAHAVAANRLLTYLQTGAQDALRQKGFRSPDGGPSPVLAADPELRGDQLAAAKRADYGAAGQALTLWASLTKQLRMLAVVDVSGSMAQAVPGTGQTRLQLTAAASEKAMALFGSHAAMGLWTFTTTHDAAGSTVIDQVLPIAELGAAEPGGGTHGQRMIAAYGALADKAGSRNGLYDVLLAAYQNVQKGWDPTRTNTVAVFTDGKDDDLNSMTSDQLIAKLQAAVDPARPIRVFVVALGTDVDLTLLNKITAVTGGAAVHFSDMGQMTAAILGSTDTR